MNEKPAPKAVALLPVAVFLVLYLVLGIVLEYVLKIEMGFYQIPIVVAFLVALLVACLQNRSVSFDEKLVLMGQGIGDKNIVTMILIFLVAGIFVGVTGRTSAEAVAYFLLSIAPVKMAVAVLFVVACFVSMAMGTSVGTITLLAPSPWPCPPAPALICRCASPLSWAAQCSATTSASSPTPRSPPAPRRARR